MLNQTNQRILFVINVIFITKFDCTYHLVTQHALREISESLFAYAGGGLEW
jgi:hypothetical protein